ncbi:general substrate transporter [Cokeromyces recurvatus]|uniref:general substrate transporter n=1 Tax=Cokeromyces recurvatus TaxID=90255 RepID=UPI00221E4316|nr:general substrate transporter [Cokeromyces recurvatus]KAI7897957.1 general substrate transporter [Cokeromyces recurvatus]
MGYLTRLTSNVYAIGAFAAIAGIMFGFDIGSNSGVIGTIQYKDYFHDPGSVLQGGINGSLSAGCFVGALIAGFFADKYSRKYTLIGASVIFIIGSVFQAASNGVALLCVGRVLNGISVGITSMVVPLYQSEIAPKEIRGRIVAVQQWAITWGIMISFWIQYGCQFIKNTAAFRIPWGVQAVPAIILTLGMWAFPFSPRWLASKGRVEEALKVIADIHGNGDIHHPRVQLEMEEINATIHFDKEIASHSYADLLKPGMFYRVSLGVCLQVWQQLTGMNIIMFYVVFLFQQAGIGDSQEAVLVSSGVSYVVNVVMTIPAILYVDRWGRRPTMIVGALLMSVFLWVVGGVLSTGQWAINPQDGKWQVLISKSKADGVVACIYLFVACFATTWGPLGWIYPAEIYPLRVRAKAVSLSTASNWLFNWVLNFVVPLLMERIRYGLYFLFAAFNFLMALHVFIAYPETKGYTLEEMDIVFEHNPRKKIPHEVIEKWIAEKGLRREEDANSGIFTEKKENLSHAESA